ELEWIDLACKRADAELGFGRRGIGFPSGPLDLRFWNERLFDSLAPFFVLRVEALLPDRLVDVRHLRRPPRLCSIGRRSARGLGCGLRATGELVEGGLRVFRRRGRQQAREWLRG